MSLLISLTTDEVEKALGKRFTDQERLFFATTPVVDRVEKFIAFPIPADNSTLTLSNVKDIFGTDPQRQPSFFDHPWYADEPFMKLPVEPSWHVIGADVLSESVNQPSDYMGSLSPDYGLPHAVEVILMLFLYYIRTGEQLLFKKHTWCADSAGLGEQVTVGAFGRNGVFVSKHPRNYASRGLGVCPKILKP